MQPQVLYEESKCLSCGACAQVCSHGGHGFGGEGHGFLRENCRGCLKCTELCPSGALEAAGKEMSAQEVLDEVMRDEVFYQSSGGGMTLSGGEPLAQGEFSRELLALAKGKGLHTCVETCGYAPWESLSSLLPLVDLFLYDYKLSDPEKHREYTGVDNHRILENLKRLDEAGAKTILRCPVIPGINDTPEHFAGIARTANRLLHLQEVHVEPYHPLGANKAERLGEEYALKDLGFPSEEQIASWVESLGKEIKVCVRRP